MNDDNRLIRLLFEKMSGIAPGAIPDGVIDLSPLIEPLVRLSKRERLADTDEPGQLTTLAFLLLTGRDPRFEEIPAEMTMIQAIILLMLILLWVSDNEGVLPEELAHRVFHSDDFSHLLDDFKAVPFDYDDQGLPVPRLNDIRLFRQRVHQDRRHARGFVRRSRLDPESIEEILGLIYGEHDDHTQSIEFEIVDASTIEFVDDDSTYGWEELLEKYLEEEDESDDE